MLQRLRELIRSGGTFEVRSLAVELGTTPGLVRMMLDQLEQMGVVRANPNCESGCGQCGLKNACKVGNKDKQNAPTWVMIESSR